MLRDVEKIINKHDMLSHKDSVLVGVSGGPDSVALLHCLYESNFELRLHVVHINHMLRGKESDRDEQHVRNLVEKMGIEGTFLKIDVQKKALEMKLSTEEAARICRYEIFEATAKINDIDTVALAHHKDDQVETVLMRILRGTGTLGLGGIKPVRFQNNLKVIRPLINIKREDILRYCHKNSLAYIEDSSNKSDIYMRNKIRNILLPLLRKEYNYNVDDALIKLSQSSSEDEEALAFVANIHKERSCIKENWYDVNALCDAKPAIIKRAVRMIFKDVSGTLLDMQFIHLDSILDILLKNITGTRLSLPGGYEAKISNGRFTIIKSDGIIPNIEGDNISIIELKEGKKTVFSGRLFECFSCDYLCSKDKSVIENIISSVFTKTDSSFFLNADIGKTWVAFDRNKIISPLVLSKIKNGDKMVLKGIDGRKKISDIFIDSKTDRKDRNIPVLRMNDEILWLVGTRTSSICQVDDKTTSLIVVKMELQL